LQGFGGSAPAEDAATAKGFTTDVGVAVAVADTDVGVEGLTATAKGFTTDVVTEDEFDADEFDADASLI
jgi:hypothetical protein